jgi:hypothetical protein
VLYRRASDALTTMGFAQRAALSTDNCLH